MNSFTAIWERALIILENEMTKNDNFNLFVTWIKELKPEFELNGSYYFEVATEIHKDIITSRFSDTVKDALQKALLQSGYTEDIDRVYPIFITPKERANLDFLEMGQPTNAPKHNISLNPNYTFDSFIVGKNNKFAHAASLAVAQSPGNSYNPLFIYGGVGLGKTHLMHAIGNYISTNHPNKEIMYVTTETFTNELISSIQKSTNDTFRNKYRKVDVLLIDDIQIIAGKESTQEEFFHTFNALHEANKQIIISSDKPPKEIATMEERLRSRFEGGLIADIGVPDYETRVAILRNKAQQLKLKGNHDIEIDDEVLHYIASKLNSNIRKLEGALQKVMAYAKLNNSDIKVITRPMAETVLDGIIDEDTPKVITPKLVIATVCKYFNVSEEDLLGKKKNREIAFPRQITMYIMRQITDLTYPKIGSILGGRDHSTAMHADDKISSMIKEDEELDKTIKDIIAKIKE